MLGEGSREYPDPHFGSPAERDAFLEVELANADTACPDRERSSWRRQWPWRARRLVLGLAVSCGVALAAFLVLQGRRHDGGNSFTIERLGDESNLQRKFDLNSLVAGDWKGKDPFLFECPLPESLAASVGRGVSVKHVAHEGYSITFDFGSGPGALAYKPGSKQSHSKTEDGGRDFSPKRCCKLYSKSWWPYQYPECEEYGWCPSCFKESLSPSQPAREIALSVAGAAWAAAGSVYEKVHRHQFDWTGSGHLLLQMHAGLHRHVADVCPKVPDWHQYEFEFGRTQLRVRAYKSNEAKLAIISFRGTEPGEIMNWLVDLNINTEKLHLGGKATANVHRGYIDALVNLMPKVKKWVDGYVFGFGQVPKDWKLVFTGHSMGGAFAILAATLVFKEGWERQPDAVVTFGAPRVADEALSNWWEQQGLCDKLLRINVYNDIVHQVPFAKQAITSEFWLKCFQDLTRCFTSSHLKGNKTFDDWWRHVCPSSEFLVPGAVKGVNAEAKDFTIVGGVMAHMVEQCRYGYAYGLMHSDVATKDKYCGITPAICPKFKCTVVENLKGIQCSDLTRNHAAKTAKRCKEMCCLDEDGSCEVWQWLRGGECWSGRSQKCSKISWNAGDVLESERIK